MNHNQYHRHAQAAAAQSAAWAVLCGLELIQAKKAAGRGDWELWVETNCEFTSRAARNYMALAEANRKTLSATSPDFELLTQAPSGLSEFDHARLLALVTKVTDGETLIGLYEEYGIVKKATGSGVEGGYRPDPAKLAEFLGAYHAELVGTPYGKLPPDVQAHFRKWVAKRENDPTQLAFEFCRPALDLFEHPDFGKTLDMIPEAEAHRMLDHVEAIARRLRERFRQGQRKAA